MAKTILNLKLQYKGKILDIAKYGRDFTSKLYIGKSKHLFWQILDQKFPEKFLFLRKKDDKFSINLMPGMDVTFTKDNKELNKDALKTQNLMAGNEVILSSDMTGVIKLNADWNIFYEFQEPFVRVYTEAEKQIISQYSRRAELHPFQKFTRNFLLAATAFTIVGLILFDTFKPDYSLDLSLAERWRQMQSIATRVELPTGIDGQFVDEPAETTEQPSEQAATGQPGGSPRGTMSRAQAQAALSGLLGAGGFDPSSTGKGLIAVTTAEDIIASTLGGGTGGGKGGTGKGTGGGGPGGTGVGDGTGFGSVFDPSEIPSGTANLAGLSSGRPQGKLSTTAPTGDVRTYVGDAGRIAPVGKPVTSVSPGIVTKFSGPSVQKVAEGGIASAPVEVRPELQRVEQLIARQKPQIKDAYRRYSQIKSMYGTLKFVVYIDSDGSVAGVQITPMSGEFYPEFMKHLEQMILNWRFDNKNLVPYEFLMTFTK